MSTPTIQQFLAEIVGILREKNGLKLQQYLILEPPLPDLYNVIVSELKASFSAFNEGPLKRKCDEYLPAEDEEGGSYAAFIQFMIKYFVFLRDLNIENQVHTHEMLKQLLKSVKPSPS